MRGLLARLGFADRRVEPGSVVDRLRARIEAIGAERCEYLAAFAGLLVRVAHIDSEVSEQEATAIENALREHAQFTEDEARLVVELARHEIAALGGVENHLLTRAFNAAATAEEKVRLVDSLYALASADHVVSNVEDREIRRIAGALLVPPGEVMDVRSRYRDRLEVMQAFAEQKKKPG